MTVLASIQAENFCQFESFELDLAKLGLVWVGGVNNDSTAASSNGSGKSNFLKAIGWCLYGETVEDEPADDVIRDGETHCVVTIKTTCGWEIMRERRRGSPKLSLKHNDNPFTGKRDELQQKIVEIVGYDWPSFLNAVLYAQRDTKRFIHPKTTDAERKKIIQHIQDTDDVTLAYDWIKKEALKLQKELSEHERDKAVADSALRMLDLARLRGRQEQWEKGRGERSAAAWKQYADQLEIAKAETTKLRGLKKRRAQCKTLLKEYLAKLSALPKLQNELSDLNDKLITLNRETQELDVAFTKRKAKYNVRKENLAALATEKTCPTCTSPMDGEHAAKHLAIETAWLDNEKLALDKLNTDVAEKMLDVRALEEAIENRRPAVDEKALRRDLALAKSTLREIETQKTYVRSVVDRAKSLKETAKFVDTEANPYDEEIASAKEAAKAHIAKRKRAKEAIERLSVELSVYEFWKKGFSPSGMPSFMLDAAMPLLTERANFYLETLADGDITINFSTQRELGSGEKREEIGITWEIEGVSQKQPSGGQWRKMEIATDLAFIDLSMASDSKGLDLLCLDEVLDGLDPVGRQRLTQLLHKMRGMRGTIFVISHDADIAEVFERSITIVKEDGVARMEAA